MGPKIISLAPMKPSYQHFCLIHTNTSQPSDKHQIIMRQREVYGYRYSPEYRHQLNMKVFIIYPDSSGASKKVLVLMSHSTVGGWCRSASTQQPPSNPTDDKLT